MKLTRHLFVLALLFLPLFRHASAQERLIEIPASSDLRGLQGLARSNDGQTYYTLRFSSGASGSPAVVEEFSVRYTAPLLLVRRLVGARETGHQGLSVQTQPDHDVRLWTTSSRDKRHAFFFGMLPSDRSSTVRLFEDDFLKSVSSSPAISTDGRFLIAQGKSRLSPHLTTIRVWQIDGTMCLQSDGDCTGEFRFEWEAQITAQDRPVQATASDGRDVWIVAGNQDARQGKTLVRYTVDGKLISLDVNFTLGLNKILVRYGPSTGYEPEGLNVYRDEQERRIRMDVGFSVGRGVIARL